MSNFRAGAASVAALACLLSATPAQAQSAAAQTQVETPPPPRPLVWTGASLFTGAYLASAVGAATAYTADDGTYSSRTILWVPAAGPFIMIGSIHEAGWDALLALDGLAQVAGLTLFAYGLTRPPTSPPGTHPTPASTCRTSRDRLTVSLAPFALRGASGAALVGTF